MLSVRQNNLQYQRSCDWPPGGQTLGKGKVLEMGIDTPVDCDVCPTEYQRKKISSRFTRPKRFSGGSRKNVFQTVYVLD